MVGVVHIEQSYLKISPVSQFYIRAVR